MLFWSKRKSIDEFHGSCHLVNVKKLASGAIVIVEKDPTRIKIYSKAGANQIAIIEELIKLVHIFQWL